MYLKYSSFMNIACSKHERLLRNSFSNSIDTRYFKCMNNWRLLFTCHLAIDVQLNKSQPKILVFCLLDGIMIRGILVSYLSES